MGKDRPGARDRPRGLERLSTLAAIAAAHPYAPMHIRHTKAATPERLQGRRFLLDDIPVRKLSKLNYSANCELYRSA